MDNLEDKESEEVYHSRLETLVDIIGRQMALLKRIKLDFKLENVEKVGKLAAIAHEEKNKIDELENYYKGQKEEIEFLLNKNSELLLEEDIRKMYDYIKKGELIYSEFKL